MLNLKGWSLDKIVNFLRSDGTTLVPLTVALLAQMPHAAAVFYRLAPPDERTDHGAFLMLNAYGYAFALEFATLFFVMRGQQAASWLFAVISILVNIAYYSYSLEIETLNLWTFLQFAPALLISLALPLAIATYSHAIAEHKVKRERQSRAPLKDSAAALATASESAAADTSAAPVAKGDAVSKRAATKVEPAIVLEMKQAGKGNQEIADALGIHRNTVRNILNTVNGNYALNGRGD